MFGVMPHVLPRLAATLLGLTGVVCAQTAPDLIQQGNVYYDKLQPAEALKYYLPAEKLEPRNADLLVRISRQYRHLLSEAGSKGEKLRLGGLALEYAKRAVALAPDDSEAHLAVGITLGKLLPMQGNRERMENSRLVKSSAETAIRLDPRNDLAWHILGRWHLLMSEVSGLKRSLAKMIYGEIPASSYEEAAKSFEKAIQLNGSRLMHHVELGRTYFQMGRTDDAKRSLTKGLAMRNTEKDDPETKEKGRELLGKLK